jgi:hypothetical protein
MYKPKHGGAVGSAAARGAQAGLAQAQEGGARPVAAAARRAVLDAVLCKLQEACLPLPACRSSSLQHATHVAFCASRRAQAPTWHTTSGTSEARAQHAHEHETTRRRWMMHVCINIIKQLTLCPLMQPLPGGFVSETPFTPRAMRPRPRPPSARRTPNEVRTKRSRVPLPKARAKLR